jgi:hypothetical protein
MWMTPRTDEDAQAQIARVQGASPFDGNDFFSQISVGELIMFPLTDNFAGPINNDPNLLENFYQIISAAAKGGWPIHVHAHHAESMSLFLDQIDRVAETTDIAALRWQIVHADFANDAVLERMKGHGMALSVSPAAIMSGQVYREMLGEERLRNLGPLQMIQSSGLHWALGSDGTAVSKFNPFVTIGWAVSGKSLQGEAISAQSISREDALIAHTRSGAYNMFEEDNLGSIEVGKKADLVVLNRDYMTIPADEISDLRPTMVVVGGRIVVDR